MQAELQTTASRVNSYWETKSPGQLNREEQEYATPGSTQNLNGYSGHIEELSPSPTSGEARSATSCGSSCEVSMTTSEHPTSPIAPKDHRLSTDSAETGQSPVRVTGVDRTALKIRGKGRYVCEQGYDCQKGGVDDMGNLVIFERNSAFR